MAARIPPIRTGGPERSTFAEVQAYLERPEEADGFERPMLTELN